MLQEGKLDAIHAPFNWKEMGETAYSDAGTGNCWKNNEGFTVPTCP